MATSLNAASVIDFFQPGLRTQRTKRTYRTRPDPFAEAWAEIFEILEANGELGARQILELLIEEDPGRFNWSQLRSLQRGIRRWRENSVCAISNCR